MTNSLDILIVDDEKLLGESLAEHITQHGLSVQAVTRVKEAIHIVKKKRPKIAIVDIFLPELDGFDLAEEIFSYAPDCKIILMSGIYDFNHEHLQQLGFEHFLKKPIDYDQLRTILVQFNLIED